LNLTGNIEAQNGIYYLFPLFPIALIFFIGAIAETNRAPFDLAEAESELVSGFMTEHSAAIFVFFFLAEYASIVLICIFTNILFLGGYLDFVTSDSSLDLSLGDNSGNSNLLITTLQGLSSGLILGLKTCLAIFTFI
jgi:NADH-ubiquinone oxidoreductase chain 1